MILFLEELQTNRKVSICVFKIFKEEFILFFQCSFKMYNRHFLEVLLLLFSVTLAKKIVVNPTATTDCYRREFTFRATQTDENGKQCWDLITAMSCWGRCDSGEIGDWRFPFKRPFHPVCVHEKRIAKYTILRNCDPGADFRISEYEYYEALACNCVLCDSSTTSCQAISTHGQNPHKEIFSDEVAKPGRILPRELID